LEQRVAVRTAQLQRSTAELQDSNEELQQFPAVVSQDLQAPLRTVANFPELLAQHTQGKLVA
jgi:light-regulated signal transduction histidine kinase (bacteriophytochrome)